MRLESYILNPLCIISLILGWLFFPLISHAAVVINEIAWMGSAVSANDEWIELYNNGQTQVNVDGWILSDGANLEIELAGAIGAGQYAVLERTDDASATGPAFLIYTGALVNSGVTLTLRRADGSTEDQVTGGSGWELVGGHNVSKDTAQLTAAGWITGVPTPGKVNTNVASAVVTATDDQSDQTESTPVRTTTIAKTTSQNATLKLPDDAFTFTLIAPDRAYVNQAVPFALLPSARAKNANFFFRSDWNFGDTATSNKATPEHVYEYPGNYVVIAEARYEGESIRLRHEITVLPVKFSITRNQAGDVQIHNNAKYEIDLSHYRVEGGSRLSLPAKSYLLPSATLTIPRERLQSSSQTVIALYDAQSKLVAWHDPLAVIEVAEPTAAAVIDTALPLIETDSIHAEEAARPAVPTETLPYLGFIGLLALGFFAVVTSRNPSSTEV